MSRRWFVVAALAGLVLSPAAYSQSLDPRQLALEEARRVLHDAVDRQVVGSAVGLIARGDQILLLDAAGELGDARQRWRGLRSTVLDYYRVALMLLNDGELSMVCAS